MLPLLLAITITSPVASGSSPQVYVGLATCQKNDTITFNIDLEQNGATVDTSLVSVGVVKNAANCTGTLDKTLALPTFNADKAAAQYTPIELYVPESGADAGVTPVCDTIDKTSASPAIMQLCVQFRTVSGGTPATATLPVSYATVPPKSPSAPSIEEGDTHLRVSWTAGDTAENISTYDVHVVPFDGGIDLAKYADRVSAQTNADVNVDDGQNALQNGTQYDVAVLANDAYGNSSALSGRTSASPTAVEDFYNRYRREGGSATGGGGCSTGEGAGFLAVLALALLALALARRKKAAVLLAVLLPLAARAQDRPPRKILFALKIDRYNPQIDSEASLAGQTPYFDVFQGRKPLRYQLEVDWEAWHPFGSLLVGVTAGYWQNIGHGFVSDGVFLTRSSDTALLDILPFGVVGTYRFDWLADHYRWFPIIPYAQAGLSRTLWVSYAGTGKVSSRSTNPSGRGSGWTNGYTTALGVALNLDALDPELAREAYADVFIQRTSLFAEYGWTRLDNFHRSGSMILTDRAWRFGLSLEF